MTPQERDALNANNPSTEKLMLIGILALVAALSFIYIISP
jgi:hypothetical protein